MGMNSTPASDRVHIGFFGKRNAGKSSVLNAVTGQDLAVVSSVKGTTTDPVYKAMELLPLGPVMMIDTPGIDDEGELGDLRVKKSYQVLNKTDVAVLVVDACSGLACEDSALLKRIKEKQIPCVIVFNKADLDNQQGISGKGEDAAHGGCPVSEGGPDTVSGVCPVFGGGPDTASDTAPDTASDTASGVFPDTVPVLWASALTGRGIKALKESLAQLGKVRENSRKIVGDLLEPSDIVVLVTPIDKAAPKGRLILPQQQTIRDILDSDAAAIVLKENELAGMLPLLGKKPKMVITDSQVFARVCSDTPEDILLTSFSILFARYKGNLEQLAKGVAALESVKDKSRILVSEGCTHHRQCGDIGTVKLPAWIRGFTGASPEFVFTSGTGFPEKLEGYHMIIHCGGCMLNEREMEYRMKCAGDQGIPMTNYGITIAFIHGILRRSLEPFPRIAALLDKKAI